MENVDSEQSRSSVESVEKELLGCCFLDPEVIGSVEDSVAGGNPFTSGIARSAFETFKQFKNAKGPLSHPLLAQGIDKAFLADVVGFEGTPIHAPELLKTVAENWLKTERVRHLRNAIFHEERDRHEDADQEVESWRSTNSGSTPAQNLLEKCLLDANTPVDRPKPLFTLGGVSIATPGNLITIKAQAASGKTSFAMAHVTSFANPWSRLRELCRLNS